MAIASKNHLKAARLALCLGVAFGMSCGPNSPPSQPMAILPGHQLQTAGLGTGYDSQLERPTGGSCIEGDLFLYEDGQSQIKWQMDLDQDDILNALRVKVGAGVTVHAFYGLGVDAVAEFARQESSHELNQSYHLSFYLDRHRLVMEQPRLSAKTRQTLEAIASGQTTAASLRRLCGDGYIDQVAYGGSFMATVVIQHQSRYHKQKVEGKVGVSVLEGLIKVETGGGVELTQWLASSKVRVNAIQRGGRPEELLRVLPQGPVECPLAAPGQTSQALLQPCNDALKALITYASDTGSQGLPAQFENPSDLAPLYGLSQDLANTPVQEALAPKAIPASKALLLQQRKIFIAKDLEQTLATMHQAERLAIGAPLPDQGQGYQTQMLALVDAAHERKQLLIRAQRLCHTPPRYCLEEDQWSDFEEALNKQTLNVDLLYEFEVRGRFEQWCESYQAQVPHLSSDEAQTVASILALLGTDSCQEAESFIKNTPSLDLALRGDARILAAAPLANSSFQAVQALRLSGQPLTSTGFLANWENLSHLEWRGHSMTRFPDSGLPPTLRCLDLSEGSLLRFAGKTLWHARLEQLLLNHSRLPSISPLRMPRLRLLDLGENRWQWPIDLAALQTPSSDLPRLEVLNLGATTYTGLAQADLLAKITTLPAGSQDRCWPKGEL